MSLEEETTVWQQDDCKKNVKNWVSSFGGPKNSEAPAGYEISLTSSRPGLNWFEAKRIKEFSINQQKKLQKSCSCRNRQKIELAASSSRITSLIL